MRRAFLFLGLLWLTAPAAAIAADGDICSGKPWGRYGNTTTNGDPTEFYWNCNVVCSNKAAGATSCTDFTIGQAASEYQFTISSHLNCSADATVAITTKGRAGDDPSDVATLDYNSAAPTTGVTRAVLTGPGAHPLGIVSFTLSNLTGCTNFEVLMWRAHKTRGW